MAVVIALLAVISIPGLVVLLVVFAAIDRMGLAAGRRLRLPWHTEESGRPMSAAGVEELQAIFYATKRHELDERRTSLLLRDEAGDGAPPRGGGVDLDARTAVIRRREPGRP